MRSYDKDGRLEKVTDWLEHTTKFAYNPNSDLSTTTFPSSTSDVDTYAYNEADQMSEAKMAKGTETLASLVYTRDNDGQLKSLTSKGLPGEEKPSYEYDSNSRLTKAGATGYEYDAANDPTKIGTTAQTFATANELEKSGTTNYTYNEVGERSKLSPSTGAATTYTYDEIGNLIAIEKPKEGKNAAIADTFTYDGNGLRVSQTISGTTSFLAWQVNEAMPLLLNDGTNSYIYGPEGLPIEQINSSGTALYLHHDQQGSTRLLTGSTGKTEGSYTYTPYGAVQEHTGSATTALAYDGQYTSSDTGLIYLRARTYDPSTAQFLSIDPLVSLTGEPYSYGGDNPLANGDPAGLSFWSTLGQVAGVGAVCVLTDGAGCLAAGLADLDANVVVNDIEAAVEPCSASTEESKTFTEVLGFAAGAGVGGLASLSPEIEAALQGVNGGKLASAQLKALGIIAGDLTSLLAGREHQTSSAGSGW